VIYSKCDGRFRVAALFLLLTLLLAALSSGLPNRQQNLSRPPDVAPSLAYPFGTNRTGKICLVDGLCCTQFAHAGGHHGDRLTR
jgi:hypothetical protein